MLISAHDIHNQHGSVSAGSNPAISAATPAWGHMWHAQNNVTPAITKATGGTYAMVAPETVEETVNEAPETPKKGPGRPRKAK